MKIKFEKSWTGSVSATVNERVHFYAGSMDHWGLGVELNFYDRSFTIKVLNWYIGFEIWHSE